MTGITAPGYTVVNLAANYAVSDNVSLFARIDNLFNKQYEDPSGFDRPGFGIFGGVNLKVGGLPSSGASSNGLPSNGAPPSVSPKSGGVM
jgi:outer membrane receptor protein involved in Fe transport